MWSGSAALGKLITGTIIDDGQQVGIGTGTQTLFSQLTVESSDDNRVGEFRNERTTSDGTAVYGITDATGGNAHYGVQGTAKGATENRGVYGSANGVNQKNIGLLHSQCRYQ